LSVWSFFWQSGYFYFSMKKYSFISLLLIYSLVAEANIFYTPSGGRAVGTGNQFSNTADVFSASNNPAGLGFVNQFSFGVFAERRFLVSGLDLINGSIALPTKTGTFGIGVNYFGRKEYNEKLMSLSFGKLFAKKFSVGVKFDYLNYSIAEYGQRNLFTFDVGFQYQPLKNLLLGAHVFNPLPLELEKVYGEKVSTIIRFGAAYNPVKKVTLLAEFEKDLTFKPNLKFGLDYRIVEIFSLRAGVNSFPLRGTFGFGLNYKGFHLDFSGNYHPVLGVTPQVSLSYYIKKKEKNAAQ
jgi:hypothetical protein